MHFKSFLKSLIIEWNFALYKLSIIDCLYAIIISNSKKRTNDKVIACKVFLCVKFLRFLKKTIFQ